MGRVRITVRVWERATVGDYVRVMVRVTGTDGDGVMVDGASG